MQNVNSPKLHVAFGTYAVKLDVGRYVHAAQHAVDRPLRHLRRHGDSHRQAEKSTIMKHCYVVLTNWQQDNHWRALRSHHLQHRSFRGTWMRQCVQADVRSLGISRTTQEVWNEIGCPPDVLHLLKVELRQELTQPKDTVGLRFLLKQMPQIGMIGHQLKWHTIKKRPPRCQRYLSCQGFCVTFIVVPLRTLQFA
jgi:hypothetical protein